MVSRWSKIRSFLQQDVGSLVSTTANSLDRRFGVKSRRLLGGVLVATSLAATTTFYALSKPEPAYAAEVVSYTVTDTISVPQQHVVKKGESLWTIVGGESNAEIVARVKEVCAMNPYLGAIDNRAVEHGVLRYVADSVPCDYLPEGALLKLPPIETLVQCSRQVTLYHPLPSHQPIGVFFGVFSLAASIAAAGVTFQRSYVSRSSPQLELFAEYTPTISI